MIQPVLSILFGVLFTTATAAALGRLVLARLRIRLYRTEQWLFSLLLGMACLSACVFMLAALHLVHKGEFLGLGVLAIALALKFGRLEHVPDPPPLPRFWRCLFWAAYAVYALTYIFYAMAPEISPDGSTYHLGLVTRLYRAHGFFPSQTDFYKNMPAGIELLFLFAFAFGKHSAAALVHFVFLLTLPVLLASYGRRFRMPVAGVSAALLVFASPIVGIDGTSAYVDVALAAVLFGVFYLLEIWDRERNPRLLTAVGILAGFGFAIKYTGAVGLVYAFLLVAWRLRKTGYRWRRPWMRLAAAASIWILPWIIKSWILVHNPVTPFLNELFPNPYVHITWVKFWTVYLRHYSLKSYWELPLQVTTWGPATEGLVGPIYLLAPFSLYALRYKEGRRILFCALIFFLPYFGNVGARFLIPPLSLASLAMGMAFQAVGRFAGAVPVLLHLVLSYPTMTHWYAANGAWRLAAKAPIQAALRRTPEDAWLLENMGGYSVDRMLEKHVPAGSPVYALFQPSEDYTSRDIRSAYTFGHGEVMQDFIFTAIVAAYQPSLMEQFHFPAVRIKKVRVVQTARAVSDIWSIAELRVYLRGVEIPRGPEWRVRAWPNPWDVQLAFDNNLATRWRSWQIASPGMFMEADFGKLEEIDNVAIQCSPDQFQTRLKLELMDASGTWIRLSSEPNTSIYPVTRSLRKDGAAALKDEGYRYFLVNSDNFAAADIRRNESAWGLRRLDEKSDARLYWIE